MAVKTVSFDITITIPGQERPVAGIAYADKDGSVWVEVNGDVSNASARAYLHSLFTSGAISNVSFNDSTTGSTKVPMGFTKE